MAGENLLSVCLIIWIVPHRFEQLTYTGLSSHPYDSRLGEFSWDNQWKLLSAILEVSVHTHMEEEAESQYPFLSTKLLPPLNEMQLYLYKLCIPWWYISISEKVREGTTRGRTAPKVLEGQGDTTFAESDFLQKKNHLCSWLMMKLKSLARSL